MTHNLDSQDDQAQPAAATCCGQHMPPNVGKPFVLGCQLCPNSPTYWRKSDTTPQPSHQGSSI